LTGSGAIAFDATVDGAWALTATTGGLTTFIGQVGGTTPLHSLTTDGGDGTAVNGGLVKTTGLQQYSDAVTVGAAATLFQSTGGGSITFASTLDGASAVTATTAGQTTFSGQVGGTTPLTSLTTDGGDGTAVNGGLVKTTGLQQYSDAVTVGAAVTLFQSTGGGSIAFASTLDGASAVTVTTAGQTTFSGQVGGTTPLHSLTTDGGDGTAVNGGLVKTTGLQQYSDAVTVGAAVTLFQSTGGGSIAFASTLDGASAVTVTTAGQTTFSGQVGGTTPLHSLTTDAATARR